MILRNILRIAVFIDILSIACFYLVQGNENLKEKEPEWMKEGNDDLAKTDEHVQKRQTDQSKENPANILSKSPFVTNVANLKNEQNQPIWQTTSDFVGDAYLVSEVYVCPTLGCLCVFLHGKNGKWDMSKNECTFKGKPFKKAIRREYRLLSDEERNRFHAAVRTLKAHGVYDAIAKVYQDYATKSSAHNGPGSAGWHREYLKRFEIALRFVDPSVAIPFWDFTLDANLPNPADSCIFADEFIGQMSEEHDHATNLSSLQQQFGWSNEDNGSVKPKVLPTENDISSLLANSSLFAVLGFGQNANAKTCPYSSSLSYLERIHDIGVASNDPIFFMLYAFVDNIWEMWRERNQDPASRELMYPSSKIIRDKNCSNWHHLANVSADPFRPYQNFDTLRNFYLDNLYEYGPRPNCSMGSNCGSKYLFCDQRKNLCVSKIKVGGNCQGFLPDADMCHKGACKSGICVETETKQTHQPPALLELPQRVIKSLRHSIDPCNNDDICCIEWAKNGGCKSNENYMNYTCRASCGQCEVLDEVNLKDVCKDRHWRCPFWADKKLCDPKLPAKDFSAWMRENCRKSCSNKTGLSCTTSEAKCPKHPLL